MVFWNVLGCSLHLVGFHSSFGVSGFSKTLAKFYQMTWNHIPGDNFWALNYPPLTKLDSSLCPLLTIVKVPFSWFVKSHTNNGLLPTVWLLSSHCSMCHVDKICFKQQQSYAPDYSYFTTMNVQLMIWVKCECHLPTQSYFIVQTNGLLFHSGSEATVHSPEALVWSEGSMVGRVALFYKLYFSPTSIISSLAQNHTSFIFTPMIQNNLSKWQQSHFYVSMRKDII
jgi:hypothetical protein